MAYVSRVKKAFYLVEFYMLGLALFTLFQVGTNAPVAVRFNYKLEPTRFLPAIVAVFILPVLVAFVYYMTLREPDKLNKIAYWIYCGMLIFIMAAQTLLCIHPL